MIHFCRRASALALLAATLATPPAAHAGSEPYIGELMLFAAGGGSSGWCPAGWLPADGRLLPISSNNNAALFALIGTTYGGNGQTDFGLPDLRGRVPVGQGQGLGMAQNMVVGQVGGQENVTLTTNNLPPHSHTMAASTAPATHAVPAAGRLPAQAQNAGVYAASGSANTNLQATGVAGGSQPFSVRNPYLVLNWCIAVQGLFPPRP